MSRLGKRPIAIPSGVTVEVKDDTVSVKGPKGTLSFEYKREVEVKVSEEGVVVEKKGKSKEAPAIWGTTARMIENLITGVTAGFQKQLELNGVGFRMAVAGKKINLALGFSHPVEVEIVEGIDVKIEGNTLTVSGIDKHAVGQFAANVRKLKPVEPYKGKGFKYVGEFVRRKEGKRSAA
ncbi:MAG: 50S ribosomal protein L6 [uncultured bacterium]|nr:MAG: 50S ribosomal protein L6 [uncultured bacterium]KKT88682.1 MAG: 50S ribosomal protein L6 [Candidatus Moranbacteria bacterium GW2011_GWC2_45_10]KKT95320.1 MAG: 50S ribosomal protein L6 [Parcubacteria group bacterium GW2011_GWC1_45_14]HAV11011.1 50S ribosomal protein L6 [Candidatus Moranbacteria bacterium]